MAFILFYETMVKKRSCREKEPSKLFETETQSCKIWVLPRKISVFPWSRFSFFLLFSLLERVCVFCAIVQPYIYIKYDITVKILPGAFSPRWRQKRRRKLLPLPKLKPKRRPWKLRRRCWNASTATKRRSERHPPSGGPRPCSSGGSQNILRRVRPGETSLTTMQSSNSHWPLSQPWRK